MIVMRNSKILIPSLSLACAVLGWCGAAPSAEARVRRAVRFPAAERYCKRHRISIYHYHRRFLGNRSGFTAPFIRTKDGGLLIVGSRSLNKPGRYRVGRSWATVVKLDSSGRVRWRKTLRRRGFLDYEGASAVETPGGDLIGYVLAYVHPARGSVTWLLKYDARGRRKWQRMLRGKGRAHTPYPQTLQLLKNGDLLMKGHIYLDRSSRAYHWTGKVNAKGKVTQDRVGGRLR
jgi:hypothetical protein